MANWALIAGGRCRGEPWRVGLVGVVPNAYGKSFLFSDSDWKLLREQFPLDALKQYGNANGLSFARVETPSLEGYDGVLLIEYSYDGQVEIYLNDDVRRYLLLCELVGKVPEGFHRVFLPAADHFNDERLIYLNQPIDFPIEPLAPRHANNGYIKVWAEGEKFPLTAAHFALCQSRPKVSGWLPQEWQVLFRAGVVPVYLGDWPVPDWLPSGCYVDGRGLARETLMEMLDKSLYEKAFSQLNEFLSGPWSYPYSVDFWINGLTAAIAADAQQVRQTTPLLTVVIPTFNYGRFLGQAVRSVLEQGIDSIEVLVLDNASVDETRQVMQAFAGDSRVRYMRNRRNIGASYNLHNGIWIASGEFLYILHADDFIRPGHLRRLLSMMGENPQVAVGYSPIIWVDEQGRELNGPKHTGHRQVDYVGGRNEMADLLIHDNYITPSATLYRRAALRSTWRRFRNISGAGDWSTNILMAERFPDFAFVSTPGICYRYHAAQHSSEFYSSNAPLADHIRIIEGVFERGTEDRLRGREREVAAHLERRLARYPQERDSELGSRARQLCERLEELARQGEEVLFSIILTTYNRPGLLKDALASVGNQSLRDFEVILINDCGDPVESLVSDYDFPITYIRQGRNRGLSAARNAGLKLARGRYIVYLDDDDIYLPNHLAVLAEALERNPQSVVYTAVEYVTEKLEGDKRIELDRSMPLKHDAYDRNRLFIQNYIPVNTWAHPRSMLAVVGEFDTGLTAFEDWDMLLRLAARYPFVYIPQVTAEVHQRPSAGNDHMLGREQKNFVALYQKLYERHSDLGSEVVRAGRQELLKRLGANTEKSSRKFTAAEWLGARTLTEAQKNRLLEALDQQGGGPVFGIVLLDLKGEPEKLQRSLESLREPYQSYVRVQPIVLTASSEVAAIEGVRFVPVTESSWLAQLNGALSQAALDWFIVATAGEEFTANGLLVSALDLASVPGCRAVYADEMMRQDVEDLGALLRPDLNLDLLLSLPASMAHHWLFRRDLWLEMGGFAEEYPQAFELEYILRLIERGGFDGLGHISEPLLITDAPVLKENPQEREVIARHLIARGYHQPVVKSRLPGRYEIDYGHPLQPRVSILIVVKDRFAWVQRCLESLLAKTAYPNFEVLLLDHGNTTPEIQHWLAGIEQMGVQGLRVLRFEADSSREQIQNQAAQQADGEYLLWLGDGAGIIATDWLKELLNHALRPEVGAVGAKLLSGDGLIRHAGGVLGLGGPVGRAFFGHQANDSGYMQRLQVDQNYSALSGYCLLVRRELFLDVGGFTEEPLLSRWADADLCLRIQQRGFLNVWTPRAQLLMDEPPFSSPSVEEEDAMYARWLPALAHDQAYNPSFALGDQQGFKLAPAWYSWKPLQPLGTVPLVLAHNADTTGCGHYRILQPHRALKEAGLIDGQVAGNYLTVTELERYNPDAIVLQRQIGETQYELIRRMQAFSRAFKVFELDDYILNIPLKSVHRATLPKDIAKSLRRVLGCVDRFVVSTEPLAEALAGMHGDIQVARNSLDPRWWGNLTSERRVSSKPRVGWAGGISHTGDLEMVADVVRELAGEVEWVFFGMCPDRLRPYVHEYHPGVDIELYPAALAKMNLDLAIAPVEENLFNECKSNLRLLEYGACGFPVVCSDLVCYQGDLPVTRVRNRFKDWVDAIRMHLADLDATAKQGDALRAAVLRDWMLEGANLERWRQVWLP